MSWNHPFVLALIAPALAVVWSMFHRWRGVQEAARYTNIRRLWADRYSLSDRPSATRRRARGIVLALGALAALLALARPQWGTVEEKSYDHAREVLLALDLSRSMLADDVTPTRLARAKLLIESLLDQLRGERVGLVVFSGTAFLQSPLSADYEVLRDLLPALDPAYLPQDGTDYQAMLTAATKAFGQSGDGDRFLIVLSDGEAHDEEWKAFIPTLRERGVHVIGLGVGTPQGALLPDGAGGFLKDEQGAAVLSRLEPRTLQELATQTGGTYRDAATWVDVAELVNATVDQGRKGRYVEQKNVHLRDQYQWFLAPAIVLFLLSYWLELPVFPVARTLRRRDRQPHAAAASASAVAAALLLLLAAPLGHRAAAADTPPNPLEATVAELVAKPQLGANDYARLATDTITFASQPTAAAGAARTAVLDDALNGVDRGEQLDGKAADWPALRQQLEQLKQAMQEPPKQDQQDQQLQQQQQQGGGSQEQQQPGGGGGQQKQNQHGQPGQSGEQAQNDAEKGSPDQPNAHDGQSNSNSEQASQNDPRTDANSSSSPREQQEKQEHAQANGGKTDEQNAEDSHQAPDTQRPDAAPADQPQRTAAAPRPVERADTKPLQSADAGFGDLKPQDPQPASGGDSAESKPATRIVGGGRALQGIPPQGDPALADAAGKMERVKDGDSPGVLFDRMNRAEHPRRPDKRGKNW